MASVKALVEAMRRSPTSVRFSDLDRVCRAYFGEPRHNHGMAKPYQVRQVLAAVSRLEEEP
jgi:hypothetical protein